MAGLLRTGVTGAQIAFGSLIFFAAPQAHALTIALDFAPGLDSYFLANTAALEADAAIAANKFSALYSNDVTIHITIQADTSYGALASSIANFGATTSYSVVRNAMVGSASTAASLSAVGFLPTDAPASALAGGFRVATAESKALGLSAANDPTSDGTIYVGSSANWNFNGTTTPAAGTYSLVEALEHEISEVMGRTTNMSQASWQWNSPVDLLRYTAPGVLNLSAAATGVYFSVDGGKTLERAYNAPNNNYADIQDWASGAVVDSFDAYATTGQYTDMSLIDRELLNTLGWRSKTLSDIVPEPATWALMITGFGMTGSALRRRRRRAAQAAN